MHEGNLLIPFFYEFFRILGMLSGYPLQWLFFKTKVYYEDNANKKWKKGGKLIVSNHYNVVDYIQTAFMVFPRRLIGIAAEFAFRNKWQRHGIKFFGAIEANRKTRDMSFIDRAAEEIDKGRLVQIFPEAQNTPDGQMHEFKPSYIHIAARSNGKIQPIITDGNYGLFKRVHVLFGKEINIHEWCSSENPSDAEIEELTARLKSRMDEMKAELERLKKSK